jgi:RND family efflux transporter MFP subunit
MPARPFVPVLTASLALVLTASCQKGAGDEAEASVPAAVAAREAPLVEVARISGGAAVSGPRASGLIAWQRESALSFGASGEILTVLVDEGDRVSAGQTLATLRRTTTGADAREADIARRTAEDQLERVRTLHEKGFASQAALDNAKLAAERARQDLVLTAPVSGVILSRSAERGQVVSPGQGVLSLGEAGGGVVVRAHVPAATAASLATAQPAAVEIRGHAPLTGKVSRIAPRSAAAAGVFEVEVALDNASGLRAGEVAEVVFATGESGVAPEIAIPVLALTDARADQGVVFVVGEDGVARRRAVETGGVDDRGVIILKGLAPGDAVITRGATMVRDGDAVRVSTP